MREPGTSSSFRCSRSTLRLPRLCAVDQSRLRRLAVPATLLTLPLTPKPSLLTAVLDAAAPLPSCIDASVLHASVLGVSCRCVGPCLRARVPCCVLCVMQRSLGLRTSAPVYQSRPLESRPYKIRQLYTLLRSSRAITGATPRGPIMDQSSERGLPRLRLHLLQRLQQHEKQQRNESQLLRGCSIVTRRMIVLATDSDAAAAMRVQGQRVTSSLAVEHSKPCCTMSRPLLQ